VTRRAGGWWRRATLGAVLLSSATVSATSVLAAQSELPAAAVAAARAAATDTAVGNRLQVILLTAGQGDAVWEKFGHNMLWIRDTVTGEGLAWNWGKFSFNEPGFLQRFLLGDTRYWMEGDDVAATLAYYESTNREVVAQELALTPGERAALLAFVTTNAREEHKFYRYDYFLDNCSTRLRDALDLVTGGALRAALADDAYDVHATYRGETLRLVQDDAWLVAGIDLALGAPANVPLSRWETAFVPMRLRDAVRGLRIDDGAGGTRALVVQERMMVNAQRGPEVLTFPKERFPYGAVLVALVIASFGLGLGLLRSRGMLTTQVPIGVLAVAVHLLIGLVATAVLAMWLFTKHNFWAWNAHLLLMTPVSLVLAVAIPIRLARGGVGKWISGYHLVVGATAFAVALVTLVRFWQNDNAPGATLLLWAHASWMVHFALGYALAPRRIRERSPS
jgi:hypothetical protein